MFVVIRYKQPVLSNGPAIPTCDQHFETRPAAQKWQQKQEFRAAPLIAAGMVSFEIRGFEGECPLCYKTFD
jgi:hypothetical protein